VTDKQQKGSQPVKILVVDDEEIVLALAQDALEDMGYEVSVAGGGKEAIARLEQNNYDFILTDIRMPECDGLQLARQARTIAPSVGIIFMTGYANITTAKDAIKEGAYDYIMKPFELSELRQAVENAVAKKQKDTEKTLSGELNRLSDLNQLMYAVNDRKSLMRLSLGFALMQGKANSGCILFKSGLEKEIGIITGRENGEDGFQETSVNLEKDYFKVNSEISEAPVILNSIEEHPLYKALGDSQMGRLIIPGWYSQGQKLINLALRRGSQLYGFIILGYPDETETVNASDMKLLGITAGQITISLENIILLEESRNAYKRLKELQDETIQLEKMATKGRMSAEIGHELNNFLGVILGNATLMQHYLQKQKYDELSRHLDMILSNLDSMNKFTDNLMNLPGERLKLEPCEINSHIGNVIEYLVTQKHFRDVAVTFHPSGQRIQSLFDSGQLQQLLYNLINNASEALLEKSDDGPRTIDIFTELDAPSERFTVIIRDNGIGMEKNLIDMAFKQRFTTKKTGHGYGLLVCTTIIENHRGKLHVDSAPGEGTAIRIDFPLLKEDEQPVASEPTKVKSTA